tara:strand:+ start:4757 stop:4933 length:177 start_codon:yes stop_codon:yes gene_type:complete
MGLDTLPSLTVSNFPHPKSLLIILSVPIGKNSTFAPVLEKNVPGPKTPIQQVGQSKRG